MLVQSRLRLEELQREQTRLKACIWRIEEQILQVLNDAGEQPVHTQANQATLPISTRNDLDVPAVPGWISRWL